MYRQSAVILLAACLFGTVLVGVHYGDSVHVELSDAEMQERTGSSSGLWCRAPSFPGGDCSTSQGFSCPMGEENCEGLDEGDICMIGMEKFWGECCYSDYGNAYCSGSASQQTIICDKLWHCLCEYSSGKLECSNGVLQGPPGKHTCTTDLGCNYTLSE